MTINTNSSMPAAAVTDLLAAATVPHPRQSGDRSDRSQSSPASGGQIDLTALRDSLTPAQRSGRACIQCGRSDLFLQPAGTLLDIKVVECYSHKYDRDTDASSAHWLPVGACPPWCNDTHRGADHPEDRQHGNSYLDTTLQTLPYDNYRTSDNPEFKPVTAMANLIQHYREAEPRICFADTRDQGTYYMTLDEAQAIALNLMTLVVAGRDRAAIAESPDTISETSGCQPWCRDHHADDFCKSGLLDGAWLTYDKEDGAYIWFSSFGDDGHTLAQAERLVRSILRVAVLARRSQAAGSGMWRNV